MSGRGVGGLPMVYGLGGLACPFVFVKLIDMLLTVCGLA